MGGFFHNLMMRFRQFMQGRYGADNLSYFTYGLAILLWIVNTFLGRTSIVLTVLAGLLLFWSLYRMFSKNLQARYRENAKYLAVKNKLISALKGGKTAGGAGSHTASPDKTHKIYNCPACKQKVRVPTGRGKIEITCPKCGNHFKRRS